MERLNVVSDVRREATSSRC